MRLNRRTHRFLRALLGAAVALAVVIGSALLWYATAELATAPLPLQFELRPGSSLRSAAHEMERAGVLREPGRFVLMVRLLGEAKNIKAGSYEVSEPVTPYRLLQKIVQGEVTQAAVKFVEGWTFRQIRATLDEHPEVAHFTRGLTDQEILQRLGIEEASPEGLFFPDTYLFARGSSDAAVMRRAYHAMQRHLQAEWEGREPGVPYHVPYEALIMASIIEKETGLAAERELIAGALVNRLRIGMRLQVDPTIIYGLGEAFDGNLKKKHLLEDGPYNTYTRAGLPPSPIAMPGLASLHAAMQPAKTDALYYVSRGDGSSHFSPNIREHNRAVSKYQLKR